MRQRKYFFFVEPGWNELYKFDLIKKSLTTLFATSTFKICLTFLVLKNLAKLQESLYLILPRAHKFLRMMLQLVSNFHSMMIHECNEID